jgi:hypothetical protein
MANQAESTRFRDLFESALQAYEKKAGVTLAEHPLAVRLQSCESVQSITTVMQDQAQAFNEHRGSDRVMGSIKNTLSILTRLSATASLAVDIGLVRQQVLTAFSALLIIFTASFTCESNTCRSRYPAFCMCPSPVHI